MLRVKLTTALAIAMLILPSGAYALPDAKGPIVPASKLPAAHGLRSPDGRDAWRCPCGERPRSAARSAPSVSDGFEWSDAAIGAAATLALLTVSGGTVLLVGRSRRRAPTA